MKRFLIVVGIAALFAAPLSAEPTAHFTTPIGGNTWTLTNVGGTWFLSFLTDSAQVDWTVPPADAFLMSDLVNLPTMALSGIGGTPALVTATLTPLAGQTLSIKSQPIPGIVFDATVGTGATLEVGPTYIAYPEIQGDLTINSYTAGYSDVLDAFAAAPALDLYFAGTASNSISLPHLLLGLPQPGILGNPVLTTASGNFAGSINALPIPAPGALLLVGLGASMVGWLRTRKKL